MAVVASVLAVVAFVLITYLEVVFVCSMCVSPYWISAKRFVNPPIPIQENGGMYVPCGRCPECLHSKQLEWVSRFKLEDKYWLQFGKSTLFITLTYDTENIKVTKKELQNDYRAFLKQIGRVLHCTPRYYICSEFGSVRGRVHFHGLLFGVQVSDMSIVQWQNLLQKAWHRGFVSVSVAQGKDLAYVSKYVTKDIEKHGHNGSLQITACSKRPALGLLGVSPAMVKAFNRDSDYGNSFKPIGINFDGYHYPLPRYIADKVLTDSTKKARLENGIKYFRKQYVNTNIQKIHDCWSKFYRNVDKYKKKKIAEYYAKVQV